MRSAHPTTLNTTVRARKPTGCTRWVDARTRAASASADSGLPLSSVDRRPATVRRAFTLVELLVAITILVILTTLVLSAFQQDDGDRLNASSRLIQSYFEGARSRAISEGRVIGVRLIPSANDPFVVESIAYVGSAGYVTGTLSMVHDGSHWVIVQPAGLWHRLSTPDATSRPEGRDLLQIGSRIEIPEGSGNWYTIGVVEDYNDDGVLDSNEDDESSGMPLAPMDNNNGQLDFIILDPSGTNELLALREHYTPSDWSGAGYVAQPATGIPYRLELAATLLPNTEPISLQRGTCIDLAASRVSTFDILFDPRGNPVGNAATAGLQHLYITTLSDVELTRGRFVDHPANATGTPLPVPIVPAVPPTVPKFDPYVVTLFSQTGQITTSRVDFTDAFNNVDGSAGADEMADIPFRFAQRGREAQ